MKKLQKKMMQTIVANSSIATDIVSFLGTFYMSDRIKNTFMMCIYEYQATGISCTCVHGTAVHSAKKV